jgi:hypothetical protein
MQQRPAGAFTMIDARYSYRRRIPSRAATVRAAAEKTPGGFERDALFRLAARWESLAAYKTVEEP